MQPLTRYGGLPPDCPAELSLFSLQITHTASLTLTHCAFLCTVLSETAHNKDHLNLAFQIGMFGLEMAR